MTLILTLTAGSDRVDQADRARMVSDGTLTIGRGGDCEWMLPDPDRQMSKQHCRIEATHEGWLLTDTSTNGTLFGVAREALGRGNSLLLQDGDRFAVGPYTVDVMIAADGETTGAPTGVDPTLDPFAEPGRASPAAAPAGQSNAFDLDGLDLGGFDLADGDSDGDAYAADPFGLGSDEAAPSFSFDGGFGAGTQDEGGVLADHGPVLSEAFEAPAPAIPDDWDPLAPEPDDPAATESRDPFADAASDPFSAPAPDPFATDAGAPTQRADPAVAERSDPFAPDETDPFATQATDPFAQAGTDDIVHDGDDLDGFDDPAFDLPDEEAPDTADPPDPIFGAHAPPSGGAGPVAPTQRTLTLGGPTAPAGPDPTADRPATRPTGPISDDPMTAFLDALGVDRSDIPEGEEAATMARAGAVLREAIFGLRSILAERSEDRSRLEVEQTALAGRNNNALKIAGNDEDALKLLLLMNSPAFRPAPEAVAEATRDLRIHHKAMVGSMQAAVSAILKRFDPKTLENQMQAAGLLGTILPAQRKARSWEVFCSLYAHIAEDANEDFVQLFGEQIAKAYREALGQ